MNKNLLLVDLKDPKKIACIASEEAHFTSIVSWFNNAKAFTSWAGPQLSFVKEPSILRKVITKGSYLSYSLLYLDSDHEVLLGFGQIQLWPERAHLGRLVISPYFRGKGLSYQLVNQLIEIAVAKQHIKLISLFVYDDNKVAKHSYSMLGFSPAPYPKNVTPVKNCTFMTLRY